MLKPTLWIWGAIGFCWGALAHAKPNEYELSVNISQQGEVFKTEASFRLPLNACQAYRFITDYDAAKSIPGVVSSNATRIDPSRVRVERLMRERILFFPIDMRMVLEFTERPGQGTDFVQISGQAKSYQGSWRIEPQSSGTVFRYRTESQPDSSIPDVVVAYFIKNSLVKSFEAFARAGAQRAGEACDK